MNEYPLWRYILVLVVVTLGVLYALPNLYGDDPALQVSAPAEPQVVEQARDEPAAHANPLSAAPSQSSSAPLHASAGGAHDAEQGLPCCTPAGQDQKCEED